MSVWLRDVKHKWNIKTFEINYQLSKVVYFPPAGPTGLVD